MAMSHSGVAIVRMSRTDLSRNGIPMQRRCGELRGSVDWGETGGRACKFVRHLASLDFKTRRSSLWHGAAILIVLGRTTYVVTT